MSSSGPQPLPSTQQQQIEAKPKPAEAAAIEERSSRAAQGGSIALYFCISLSLVFINKYMLDNSGFQQAGPLIITWLQIAFSLALVIVLGAIGATSWGSCLSFITEFDFDLDILVKVFPLGFFYSGMLALNNLCLKHVHLAYYQIARSLVIAFNIPFTYYFLGESTSRPALMACLVVMMGFVVGTVGDLQFSWTGVLFGVSSSIFVSLFSIFSKKTAPVHNKDVWRTLHYNSLISCFLLFLVVLGDGEYNDFMRSSLVHNSSFWYTVLLSGLLGFAINISVQLLIKHTSPLTSNIAGNAKTCVQTLLGVWIFGTQVSPSTILGAMITIAGAAWYSRIRMAENQTNRTKQHLAAGKKEDDEPNDDKP